MFANAPATSVAGIAARLDPVAAGFPLRVYVQLTLGRHTEAAERRVGEVVAALPQVTQADWVAGETDAAAQRRRARPGGAAGRPRRAVVAGRGHTRRDAAPPPRDEAAVAAPARGAGV